MPDTWPTYEGRRWLRKWCVLWFYNANGWPKRGSRDETVTHGCPCVYRSFLIIHIHVRVYDVRQGDDRFDCPLRNWVMSRHVDRVYSPIKSISGFRGGDASFYHGTTIHHSRSVVVVVDAHYHSCFSVITLPQSAKSLIYRRTLTFRGIIHRVSACLRKRLDRKV